MDENDFLGLFKRDVELADKPVKIPEKVTFTKGALDKAFAIGSIIDELTFGNFEWHGFMLANKEDPYIVRDIFIGDGAQIAPGITILNPEILSRVAEEVVQVNKEKGADYTIVGVIHSHGRGSALHSGQDDINFTHVINSYCGATQTHSRKPVSLIEGKKDKQIENEKLVLSGSSLEDAVIMLSPPTEDKLREILRSQGIPVPDRVKDLTKAALEILLQSELNAEQTVSSGFAYSVVVNLSKETYAEIGIRDFAILTGEEKIRSIKDVDVETVEVKDDIKYDDNKLFDEITEKFVFFTGKGAGFKQKVRNFVRVWSQEKKQYVWEKEDPDKKKWQDNLPKTGAIMSAVQSFFGYDDRYDDRERVAFPVPQSPSAWNYGSSQNPQLTRIKESVDKFKDNDSVHLDDLVWQFIFSAFGYVSRFRNKDCLYSEYFSEVLSILSNCAMNLDRTSMRDAFRIVDKLYSGIKQDNPKVNKPTLASSSFYWFHNRILNNLNNDHEQLNFMILFSDASSIEEQNELIKTYAGKFAGKSNDS